MALTDKLTAIANAIRAKTGKNDGLTLDQMPNEINGIQTGGGGDSDELLQKRLTNELENVKVDIRGGVIVERAFNSCTMLKSVELHNIGRIGGSYVFYLCTGLQSAKLAFESKTNATVPTHTFRDCAALKMCRLENCNKIDGSAFYNAAALDTIILPDTESITTLGNVNAFTGTPFAPGGTGGTAYVPQALIASYQNSTNWAALYEAGTCTFVAKEGSEYE